MFSPDDPIDAPCDLGTLSEHPESQHIAHRHGLAAALNDLTTNDEIDESLTEAFQQQGNPHTTPSSPRNMNSPQPSTLLGLYGSRLEDQQWLQ
jgi:hypothetical protein